MTLWVRNTLHKISGVRFPAFDLAYEFYRKDAQQENFLPEIAPSGRDSLAELITEGGTEDALDLAREAVKEFGSLALDLIPFAGVILKRLSRTAFTMRGDGGCDGRTNPSLYYSIMAKLRGCFLRFSPAISRPGANIIRSVVSLYCSTNMITRWKLAGRPSHGGRAR
jgi:hypothetical protein